ncbi:alanine racemase [Mesorhizobium sp. M1423]|uniref:alanine racemase n=1 Tax=Mesorhizobium sp. M1423 TaxID=2957101 RepID=UPI00333DE6D0
MFLQSLLRSNPAFVDAAIELHQAGQIPANSYVLDLDAIATNAGHIVAEARRHQLSVFPMTKQFGRNPEALKVISSAGIERFVAVDMACARAILNGGFAIGHLGHLVQIPRHEVAEALSMSPAYWTVFSREQASAISQASQEGLQQKVLLRIYGCDDTVVPTHAGGFALETLYADIDHLSTLPGLTVAGVTTYPSAYFDRLSRTVTPTPNVRSMQKAATILKAHGIADVQINMASELSTRTIQLAAEGGATQIEPGHAFTGTSPYQIFADAPERQAMIYISEISHFAGSGAFFFGGGLYQCIGAVEHTPEALVGRSSVHRPSFERALLTTPPNGVIDFYGRLDYQAGTDVRIGDTVVVCTRPQAFFTRAFVVPVRGISSGMPQVLGVWDVNGFRASGAPAHTLRKQGSGPLTAP